MADSTSLPLLEISEAEVEITAIRAQGAGGQNVNKVSSAIHLRFDIPASSLPEDVKERLLALHDSRISKAGVLVIKAQQHRSQEANRDAALARLHADFLGDPTTTDVITFEGDPALGVAGEICVSADTAAAFARGFPAYARATGYPVQVQWTLLAGINDGDDELDGIVRRAPSLGAKVAPGNAHERPVLPAPSVWKLCSTMSRWCSSTTVSGPICCSR
mgnify:CR=1 FL=1